MKFHSLFVIYSTFCPAMFHNDITSIAYISKQAKVNIHNNLLIHYTKKF